SFESVCKALYKGRKMGCWLATLIGGEPTLRKDIGKIASFARKIGYPCVKVCSNGSMMAQKDYVRYLADSGVNMFDVSLHGVNDSIHDKLVGSKGAFKKAMKAADNIKAIGKELGTNQVVNRLNYKTFPDFFKMALVDMGINYFNIIYGHYRGSMASNERFLRVPILKTVPYLKEGLKVYKNKKIPVFARTLVNFTPCLIPAYYKIIADWESDTAIEEPLFAMNQKQINMADMKNSQSLKPVSCAKCVFNSKCRGFDKEYFEIFGGSEFKPLKKIPKSEKLMVSFE
ncbi:MAG: radical SAM protein, partial [Elusimicrobiales bacterium]|nr:radical SAM protein [Elusimicrobiales bacterium]